MNTEQCIKNAIEADASGNTGEAMQWLKQAGEFGDANAALDYAYFKSAENPRKSVAFLEGGGECADNPFVQFHKLQIGYYGDVITNAKLVAKSLIALGNEGVIEAYLITLSYLPVNRTKFSYIASRGAPRTEYQPIA